MAQNKVVQKKQIWPVTAYESFIILINMQRQLKKKKEKDIIDFNWHSKILWNENIDTCSQNCITCARDIKI